jgi:hypothetical protein
MHAKREVPRAPLGAIAAFAELAQRERIRWYLFGAQAVAAYGVPRTAGDVDITIDLGDRSDLRSVYARLRAEQKRSAPRRPRSAQTVIGGRKR